MDEFNEFLGICKKHLKKQPSLIKLIKKRYRESSLKYLESGEFYNSLHITRARIESKPKEIFLYLRDFLEDLKCNKEEENELKRKRKDSSPCGTEDHHPAKKFKDEKIEGKDLSIQNIAKSSDCTTESKQVLETSETCAKSSTCLTTKVDCKLPNDDKVLKGAHPVEGPCESDSEIQIESLESSSEDEDPKREKMSKKEVVNFEVILNEDYSNGSTGSVLENYKISRVEQDFKEPCDSTVRDESSSVLDNNEKSNEQDSEQLLMTKTVSVEVDDEKSSDTCDTKVSVSSSQKFLDTEGRKNVRECTEVNISESVADKSPDSTTEPQEKTLAKEPMTPSKFKDVFLKLKTTVDMVKENLPMSPMQNAASSPDSSSKMDVDIISEESGHTEENPDSVQVIEDGYEAEDTDPKNKVDTKHLAQEQTDMIHETLVHTDLPPKVINNEQHENDLPGEDCSNSGEARNEEGILTRSEAMDEDVCKSPDHASTLRVEGFQNTGESPLKIVRVTSEGVPDSAKEQSQKVKAALENGNSEQKNTVQSGSTSTSQVALDTAQVEIDTAQVEIDTAQVELEDTAQVEIDTAQVEFEDTAQVELDTAVTENTNTETKKTEEQSDCGGMAKNKKKGSKSQIERLEKLLKDIRDKIEELKNAEVDLDDDDSAYIMEEKYQKKFVKVWKKLCEIKESSTDTGRPAERKFKYEGTRYPDINRKIEKFVNKQKCFPDYHDIRQIIMNVNTRKTLNIKGTAIDRLAREAFADVGDQLQKRREKDFKYTFLGHLPPETKIVRNEDDPAYDNKSLQIKLEENKKISRNRMNDVLEKFVMKQDKRGEDEEEEEEEEEEADDMQEEDVDVPEMDQIINDESQDGNLDSGEISQEMEDSTSQLSKTENSGSESNEEKQGTSKENAERNTEMTTKEVSEKEEDIVTGEEKNREDAPVPRKPSEEEDVVYIDDDDDDDDDDDCNPKAVTQDTKNCKKQPVQEETPEEIPEFIKTLHSEILSECSSRIRASLYPRSKNLSTAKKRPDKNVGKLVVDFTGKGKKFPGYQVRNIVKGSNSGYTGESRKVTSEKGNESGDDVKIVSSNILRSPSMKQSRPWSGHPKPDMLENKPFRHDKEIQFIPLKNIHAIPQTLNRSPKRSSTSCDNPSTCTTSLKRGKKSSDSVHSLSHPGDSIERKYVPAKTAVRVVKTAEEDDDDDIIVLD